MRSLSQNKHHEKMFYNALPIIALLLFILGMFIFSLMLVEVKIYQI